MAKPDPAIFLQAFTALGVSPSECIYVGDNRKNDIEPAEMLGMSVIHFDPRGQWQGAHCRDVPTLRGQLLKMWESPEMMLASRIHRLEITSALGATIYLPSNGPRETANRLHRSQSSS